MTSVLRPASAACVVIAIAVLLGGCDPKPVHTAPGAPAATGSHGVESDTKLINEGQFYIASFNLTHPARITVSVVVKSGPPIDSYFVAEQGLNAWQAVGANGQLVDFQYRKELSMAPLVSSYSHTALVPAGQHALIIDNSKLGAAQPPFHLFKSSPALVAYTISADDP